MGHGNRPKNDQGVNNREQLSNTIKYKDNEFEMMSIPDGGEGNKEALDRLKRAGK